MKKHNPILLFFLSAILLGVSACGDDEPGKASKEEVKAAFQSANDQISNGANTFSTSPGYEAMGELSVLTEAGIPFGRRSSQKREEVLANLKAGVYSIRGILTHSTSVRTNDDEPFDFEENLGVYEWNFETQDFERTGNSAIIEILFPTEGSSTNDGRFRMTAYEEEATPNGDELYSPTRVKASLDINGTKQVELDAEVEYGTDDQPVKGDVYYFVNPYAFEISFDDTKSKSSSFSESLSKSGKVLIGFGATVTFQDATKDEEFIKAISGYVQLVDVKLVVSAKAPTLQTAGDINDFVTINIKVKSKVGGKILLEQDEMTGEVVAFVKYSDGSTEPLQDLLQDINIDLIGDAIH